MLILQFSDRRGQLAIYLRSNDDLLRNLDYSRHRLPTPNAYSKDIIDTLLGAHDVGINEKFAKQASETAKGQRLNELCDHYHERYCDRSKSIGTVVTWPRQGNEDNDDKLSDFLFSQENSTPKINEFKSSVGIAYNSVYPTDDIGYPVPHPPQAMKTVSFLVDNSGSMSGSKLQDAVDNVSRIFADNVDDDDLVSMALFNHNYTPIFPFTIKKSDSSLSNKIASCRDRSDGSTAFYDAVIRALSEFPTRRDNCWLIVLTDGEDVASRYSLEACKEKVKISNVKIFIIGFNCSQLSTLLGSIAAAAGPDNGTYVSAEGSAGLMSAFNEVAALMEEPPMLT
jgi:hypothetical protein